MLAKLKRGEVNSQREARRATWDRFSTGQAEHATHTGKGGQQKPELQKLQQRITKQGKVPKDKNKIIWRRVQPFFSTPTLLFGVFSIQQ